VTRDVPIARRQPVAPDGIVGEMLLDVGISEDHAFSFGTVGGNRRRQY
jgi:hypothetical protein